MASIKLKGDTSGELTISAPAVAGTNTLTLPATTGTVTITSTGGVDSNTGLGDGTYDANTTGANNVAVGKDALFSNTTASFNTAVGYQSLYSNTTGTRNNALGEAALYYNTTGIDNTAMGHRALWSNTDGNYNTGIGDNALRFNTTGDFNTALGMYALFSNTTASNNTAVGYQALYDNTTGEDNTAVGRLALSNSTVSNSNTAFGNAALLNTTGANNTAIGSSTGSTLTTGSNNTIIGYDAEPSSATVSNEVTIGNDNVTVTRLKGNVGIGTSSPAEKLEVHGTEASGGVEILLVNEGDGGLSTTPYTSIRSLLNPARDGGEIRFGRDDTYGSASTADSNMQFYTALDSTNTERMRISSGGGINVGSGVLTAGSSDGNIVVDHGIYIGTYNGDNQIRSSSAGGGSATLYIGNAAIQVSSDERLKTNISDTTMSAVDKIKQVRIVDFNWNDPSDTSYNNRNARGTWTGVIAQELINVFPFAVNAPRNEEDLSIDTESEQKWQIDQSNLVPILLKAIQEQQAKIEGLETRIQALENA